MNNPRLRPCKKYPPNKQNGWWIRGWSHRRIFEGKTCWNTKHQSWSTQWYSDHGFRMTMRINDDQDNNFMINNAVHIHDYICNTMINIYIFMMLHISFCNITSIPKCQTISPFRRCFFKKPLRWSRVTASLRKKQLKRLQALQDLARKGAE